MELTRLDTVSQVVDALDGPAAVGRLTQRSAQAVCNWKAFGLMPSQFYFLINDRLRPLGYEAPRQLFGFVPTVERDCQPAEAPSDSLQFGGVGRALNDP